MKKNSLTRALFVAGIMATAGAMAHADAIFYPDGTHVNLGENAVENGLAAQVLAQSPNTAPGSSMLASLGVSADQGRIFAYNPMMDDTSVAYDSTIDTTTLGAGPAVMPATTATTVTTSPVYVFPNINFDRSTVMTQPHPMMSRVYGYNYTPDNNVAAATFDTPTRAGEASTMTGGAPNRLTTNKEVAMAPTTVLVPSTSTTVVDTTGLGAGPADMSVLPPPVVVQDTWSPAPMSGPSNQALPDPVTCGSASDCSNLPD